MSFVRNFHRMTTTALALGTVFFAQTAWAGDAIRVGFGTSWPTFTILQLAEAQDKLDGITIEVTVLDSPLTGYQMMAAGQLDVVYGTLDYVPIAAANDLPFALVSVLDISYGADQIVLAPGLTPADLKGRTVAATEGFMGELFMTQYLARHGLTAQDVTWQNISPDQITGPMVSGDIAAAYVYEPWTSALEQALPGVQRVLSSDDVAILAAGTLQDAAFMSRTFLASRPADAAALLKAHFDGVVARAADPVAGNAMIATTLGWPEADVTAVIGANGKYADGGVYVVDFDEAARQCGVLAGAGPFGQTNGSILTAATANEAGWISRGTLKTALPTLAHWIDCTPLKTLVDAGYRSSVSFEK